MQEDTSPFSSSPSPPLNNAITNLENKINLNLNVKRQRISKTVKVYIVFFTIIFYSILFFQVWTIKHLQKQIQILEAQVDSLTSVCRSPRTHTDSGYSPTFQRLVDYDDSVISIKSYFLELSNVTEIKSDNNCSNIMTIPCVNKTSLNIIKRSTDKGNVRFKKDAEIHDRNISDLNVMTQIIFKKKNQSNSFNNKQNFSQFETTTQDGLNDYELRELESKKIQRNKEITKISQHEKKKNKNKRLCKNEDKIWQQGEEKQKNWRWNGRERKRNRNRSSMLVTFVGAIPEQEIPTITNTEVYIGPWIKYQPDSTIHDFKNFHLVENNMSIEIGQNGLYIISVQIFYKNMENNSYWILLNSLNSSTKKKLVTCSTHSDKIAEVSCYTSIIAYLRKGNRLSLQQIESNRLINLRVGYSYIQLTRLDNKCS